MPEAKPRDLAAMAAAEGALAAESAHCPDWSSHGAAWFPGGPRRTGLAIGAAGYGAVPVGLLAAGVFTHSAALAALAWAAVLVTTACAPLAGHEPPPRRPLSNSQRGNTPRASSSPAKQPRAVRKSGHNHEELH